MISRTGNALENESADNTTDAQIAELQEEIDAIIANLDVAETGISTVAADLDAAERPAGR